MRLLKLLGASLILALMATGCAPNPSKSDVGIQLFMYNWKSVAKECEQSLGPAGLAWVLVSPPQEHIVQDQWWVHFQPVSYKLESRLGTRGDFKEMIDTCNKSGVKVIADAVINHMAGSSSGTGWAGSAYEKYNYPGIYESSDFHNCGLTNNNQIANFADRIQVQTCELLGLSDLDTGSEKVRAQISAYLRDLLSLGVAGFRIDAAKHISAEDLASILRELPKETLIFQEVIRGAGEQVQPEEYIATGKLWEFEFSNLVTSLDLGVVPNLGEAKSFANFLPSQSAISFVTNHDTERNGKALTQRYSPEAFELATLFMLASDYGTPMLYSGYFFDEYDQPPPLDNAGNVLDADCSQTEIWHCQQRSQTIIAMLKWRSEVNLEKIENFYYDEVFSAWDRGDRGLFAINASLSPQIRTVRTSLPPGVYCNLLELAPAESTCAGNEITVESDGLVELELGPMKSLALLQN